MKELNLNDFTYDLPAEKIALHPLAKRDDSKLLVYNRGTIQHKAFQNLDEFLPTNSFLFFNNTKVIPARIKFRKETGSEIEVFLLSPVSPSSEVAMAMNAKVSCTWHCTIGNVKRWTETTLLVKDLGATILEATLLNKTDGSVKFNWTGDLTFAEVVNLAGQTPLPPYLKREAVDEDKSRYQTIYSHAQGAVAAPTAGLHFTEEIFRKLKSKEILHDFLTLHVSAGTFQPIKSNIDDHVMHNEQVIVSRRNLENLLVDNRFVVAVGTTSMRTLESLYWYGARLHKNGDAEFSITQHEPYETDQTLSLREAILAILKRMDDSDEDIIKGETSIFIKPGYKFRVCNGLITNFHQPASTLILLVAAFIGSDWKTVYGEALERNYRFLSYGDSSLLLPQPFHH